VLKLSAKLIIWQVWRLLRKFLLPLPSLGIITGFDGFVKGLRQLFGIICVFTRFRHEEGVISRPAPRRSLALNNYEVA
jgi:hypothetical protein